MTQQGIQAFHAAGVQSRIVAALLVSLLTAGVACADSFRCGQWIISDDLSVAELQRKCGPPASKDVETVDVRNPAAAGGTVKRGTATIEHWTYVLPNGSRYVVTIDGGTIKSIEPAH
jgi:hypothetical protein